jgi:DNA-binding response OmpR family regulator
MTDKKKTVLLVEDEVSIRTSIKIGFEKEGFQVFEAGNGIEALSLDAKEKADIVLLDILMPEMNGYEFLEAFRKKDKKTPVVILTNLGGGEDIAKTIELGATQTFVKVDTPLHRIIDVANELIQSSTS